jgi:hypothetical protein
MVTHEWVSTDACGRMDLQGMKGSGTDSIREQERRLEGQFSRPCRQGQWGRAALDGESAVEEGELAGGAGGG